MNATAYLLMLTFRAWLIEIPVAAANAFILMDRVYAPRVGSLHAHQIAMATRIVWVFAFAFVLLQFAGTYPVQSLLYAGLFWMGLWLVFEWGGSFVLRRPVHEILIGWHVERGYMWPYVLVAYLLAPLMAGLLLRR